MIPVSKDPLIKTLMVLFFLSIVAFFAMQVGDSPSPGRAPNNLWRGSADTWLD
jgi:hypothetical protein